MILRFSECSGWLKQWVISMPGDRLEKARPGVCAVAGGVLHSGMNRRHFLQTTTGTAAAVAANGIPLQAQAAPVSGIRFSARWNLVDDSGSGVQAKFKLLKELGFDGVVLDSQFLIPAEEVQAACKATGMIVHGVVNANHWSLRLSDPTADLRRKALEELQAGIRYAQAIGAGMLEVLPGAVRNPLDENHAQVAERSAMALREVLPLAASCQVKLAVCNALNGFHDPTGADAEPGEALAGFIQYLDGFQSPWIGFALDAAPLAKIKATANWVRTMGGRLLSCEVQDLADGSEDWGGVGRALREVKYAGWIGCGGRAGDRKWLEQQLARIQQIFTAG